MLRIIIFISLYFIEFLFLIALLKSYFDPDHRIWPPPSKKSWQYTYFWALFYLAIVLYIILGIIDFDSFVYMHYSRLIIGGILFTVGIAILSWGVVSLSFFTSHGLEGEFIDKGPYKYSRNPQYIGIDIAFIGYFLITNSSLTLITGVFGILLFLFTPYVEEPWLLSHFGNRYIDYCSKVRRFI